MCELRGTSDWVMKWSGDGDGGRTRMIWVARNNNEDNYANKWIFFKNIIVNCETMVFSNKIYSWTVGVIVIMIF